MRRSSSLLRGALLFLAGALLATGAIAIAGLEGTSQDIWKTSRSGGTPVYGIDPTGVGLPLVGARVSIGAGDYAGPLRAYHDSGAYRRDLAAVGGRARSFLVRRLRQLAADKRRCQANAEREGRSAERCRQKKPAIVLDIDDTSISNYSHLVENDFKNYVGAAVAGYIAANSPAIGPILDLFELAKRRGVAVFLISSRLTAFESQTVANLRSAGYSGWKRLVLKSTAAQPTIAHKSGARARIERQGYRIIVNVGDQESDLAGGHADRAYKLPNPFYLIP